MDIKIDQYVIMPNHIHLIVVIKERHVGRSLPTIIQWFKTMTTNAYIGAVNQGICTPFRKKLWQPSFHDHIIRNEEDYKKITEYIQTNPQKWELDCFYQDEKRCQ